MFIHYREFTWAHDSNLEGAQNRTVQYFCVLHKFYRLLLRLNETMGCTLHFVLGVLSWDETTTFTSTVIPDSVANVLYWGQSCYVCHNCMMTVEMRISTVMWTSCDAPCTSMCLCERTVVNPMHPRIDVWHIMLSKIILINWDFKILTCTLVLITSVEKSLW